jgi:hypothetical protein
MWPNLVLWIVAVAVCGFVLLGHRRKQRFARDRAIAGAFSRVLQRDPAPLLYDVRELPHPKRLIRASLLRLLVDPPNEEIRRALEEALESLARYQPGVGDTPFDPHPTDPAAHAAAADCRAELQDVSRLLSRARAVGIKRALIEVSKEWSQTSGRRA